MSQDAVPARPVGWWLKEADTRLDAAFDRALAGAGADRPTWQVLSTLARRPMPRPALLDALAPFDRGGAVVRLVDDLLARGEVEDVDGALRLTAAGTDRQHALAPQVEVLRQRVTAALPPDDYATLLRLLTRLVDGLP